jgi:hypothetical protein
MEPASSLAHLKEPTACPYPEAHQSSTLPLPLFHCLKISFMYYSPIFQALSVLQDFRQNHMHISSSHMWSKFYINIINT